MTAAANPYQPPSADLGPGFGMPADSDAIAMRQEYLSHEAAVRSIGILYYLSAGMFAIGSLGIAIALAMGEAGETYSAVLVLLCVGLTFVFGWLGRAMRQLDARARVPVGLVAGLGLLNIGPSTLINGYILYLVFGKKGKVVFSEEYAAVRAATPDMRYRTSPILKFFLGFLLVAILAVLAAALLQG